MYPYINPFSPDAIKTLKEQFDSRLNQTRKRRVLNDPTQDYNYDTTAPSDLPVATNAVPYSGGQQGGGFANTLGNILQAIAAGASVGMSDNPAEALSRQLSQQMQRNMELRRMQQEKEIQKSQQDFQRQMQSTQISAQESLQKQHDEAARNLQQLANNFTATEGQKNRDFQKEQLDSRQAGDIHKALASQVSHALMFAVQKGAVKMNDVIPIINAVADGLPLDESMNVTIKSALKGSADAEAKLARGIRKQENKSLLDRERDNARNEQELFIKYTTAQLEPKRDLAGNLLPPKPFEQIAAEANNLVNTYRNVTHRGASTVGAGQPSAEFQGVDRMLSNDKMTPEIAYKAIDNSGMSPEEKQKAREKVKNKYVRSPFLNK